MINEKQARIRDLSSRLDDNGSKIMQMLHLQNISLTEKVVLSVLSVQKNVQDICDENIFLAGKKKRGGKLNIDKWREKIAQVTKNL